MTDKKIEEKIEYLRETFFGAGFEGDEFEKIAKREIQTLIEEERKKAVEGFKPRQISGFYRDDLGRWFKRYPTGGVLVTDVILTDSLNVRQEMIDEIETYLKENK